MCLMVCWLLWCWKSRWQWRRDPPLSPQRLHWQLPRWRLAARTFRCFLPERRCWKPRTKEATKERPSASMSAKVCKKTGVISFKATKINENIVSEDFLHDVLHIFWTTLHYIWTYTVLFNALDLHSDVLVCKLNKSLYGLKQSGRNWNWLLHNYLCENSFTQSDADNCVYVKHVDDKMIVIVIWVDDLIIAASNDLLLCETKSMSKDRFKIKGLGKLFLGCWLWTRWWLCQGQSERVYV